MNMAQKLATLWPEILLTATAFAVMLMGLSRREGTRRATYPLSIAALVAALALAWLTRQSVPALATFFKIATAGLGVLLLMAAAEVPDEAGADESRTGRGFDPADASRGEFFGFFLLSLVGAMLCAGADDLIWLFLALELTSLPTYVMVATSRRSILAQEAGVKYFFLGAFAAAIFLYGFALLYGATGSTMLTDIHASFAAHGIGGVATIGLVLTIAGICFKIAAVPMHMYAADVYQGAATPVSAFLAYVPKAAGFVALILVLGAVGWPLDKTPGVFDNADIVVWVIWWIAVLTMFAGNVLALLQDNVKRVLAYSSVAHSGYMLVGLAAGVDATRSGDGGLFVRNGLAAVLFYIVSYGVMNVGAFAVLGMLRRAGEEAETFDDIRGLAHRRPLLAAAMAVCVLSLLGFPPLVGFFGKLFLLGAAISVGTSMFYWLAGLLVLNSAIGAYYYLRIVAVTYLAEPGDRTQVGALPSRGFAAVASAALVVVISFAAAPLLSASATAGDARSLWSLPGSTQPVRNTHPAGPAAPRARLADASR